MSKQNEAGHGSSHKPKPCPLKGFDCAAIKRASVAAFSIMLS